MKKTQRGRKAPKARILFIVNSADFFLSHRLPVALAAKRVGYEVHVATAEGGASRAITDQGLLHHTMQLTRSGQNPFTELVAIVSLRRLVKRLAPDLVHLVTIKPVLYGGLAARSAGVPAVVAAVSGLGTVFVARGGRAKLVKYMVTMLYRAALGHHNLAVIFQNPDDCATLTSIGAVQEDQAYLIRGAGVALEDCPLVPEPEGTPVVVMASRLLRDKGVVEFVEAAKILVKRGVSARFRLIGSPDLDNPTSITLAELASWRDEDLVELPGYLSDIPMEYAQSHIVCLPSYREGLPKSLVEAAACGRAVVTTDVPGCRDAIDPGKSGLLVPPRDATALADAIQRLVENPEQRRAIGRAGRELAERAFAIDQIVEAHLAIYQDLGVKP